MHARAATRGQAVDKSLPPKPALPVPGPRQVHAVALNPAQPRVLGEHKDVQPMAQPAVWSWMRRHRLHARRQTVAAVPGPGASPPKSGACWVQQGLHYAKSAQALQTPQPARRRGVASVAVAATHLPEARHVQTEALVPVEKPGLCLRHGPCEHGCWSTAGWSTGQTLSRRPACDRARWLAACHGVGGEGSQTAMHRALQPISANRQWRSVAQWQAAQPRRVAWCHAAGGLLL